MFLRQVNWPRFSLVIIDAALFNVCLFGAYWLRFEGDIPLQYWRMYLDTVSWATLLMIAVAIAFGLYNRIWEYASLEAAAVIVATVTLSVALLAGVSLLFGAYQPRSVLAMLWGFTILTVGATRFGWRVLREKLFETNPVASSVRTRVLVYGVGDAGVAVARQLRADKQAPYKVVGFVDDNPRLRGMYAGGCKVLGSGEDLEAIVQQHAIAEIVVALPTAAGGKLKQLLRRGQSLGVAVRTIPRLLEYANGEQSHPTVRAIDATDLFGRGADQLDTALRGDYIAGRTVLVTGAGGSIGSEICRQVCRYAPRRVVLLGRGENRIHAIYYQLLAKFPQIEFVPVIANITSAEAVEDALAAHRPEVMIHAGAHKHVYLMEVNPVEAVRNNVLGTAILTDLAQRYEVDRFIMISTDKAAEPTSVMGATKRLCERLVVERPPGRTKFMAVRFGNVIGSAGSVLPIFQACIAAGRPIPVTHPEVERYFMTVDEAAFLVLQAAALGGGGETFVLDMGEPIRIVDLARTVLELNGRDPDDPQAIEFIGLRQGEKLQETLVAPGEELVPTDCPLVLRVSLTGTAPPCTPLAEAVETLRMAVQACDEGAVRSALAAAANASLCQPEPLLSAR